MESPQPFGVPRPEEASPYRVVEDFSDHRREALEYLNLELDTLNGEIADAEAAVSRISFRSLIHNKVLHEGLRRLYQKRHAIEQRIEEFHRLKEQTSH